MSTQVFTIAEPRSVDTSPINRQPSPSNVTVRIIDPLCEPQWDQLVLSHPEITFFHSSSWATVLHKTYGHQPLYLQFSEHGATLALVPFMEVNSPLTGRRGICLPFSDFCGPLVFREYVSPTVTNKLSDLARERKWKYFELRGESSLYRSALPATTFFGHHLDLRCGADELFVRCASSVRRAVRKAEGCGLSLEVARTKDAVAKFYRLHCGTRRRLGVPPQPFSFFLSIHEHVIERELGFVVLAQHDSTPVAAAIFFQFGKAAVYKFGASDDASQEMRGNNLVMWEGIKRLAERGTETLHFGRTSLENSGLRRFKLSWGAEEETLKYFRFDTRSGAPLITRDNALGFHNRVFRKMPLALNKLAGTLIYPHLD